MARRAGSQGHERRTGEVRPPAERKASPFERYQGIGNPGIPSGLKNAIAWVRRLRQP